MQAHEGPGCSCLVLLLLSVICVICGSAIDDELENFFGAAGA
jgi:hypothetical protein